MNNISMKTFEIVITMFISENIEGKSCFFRKTFLLTNFRIDVVLRITFLNLDNIEMNFLELGIFLKINALIKATLKIKQVKLVRKKDFIIVVLNLEKKTDIVYIASIASFDSYVHLF